MSRRQPIKIVQWATGAMGRSCLRAVIDRPDTEIVGLYVYGAAKAGKDAGEIVCREPTGVAATRNMEDILALDADLVIHCARIQKNYAVHDEDILRLLRSGKNVISINGNAYPPYWDEARRSAFHAACMQGGSSFLGTGLNPGFAAEKLMSTATGICVRVDHLELCETVVASAIKSPEYVFDILGFGSEPGAIRLDDESFAASITLNAMYEEVVAAVANLHGWKLDEIKRKHRMLPAKEDLKIAAGVIKKGQVSHTEWCWRGIADGAERIALSIAWAVDTAYAGERPDLWTVKITGVPNVSVAFNVDRPNDMPGRTSAEQMALAGSVANAIAYVVAAPPGLLSATFPTPYHADTLRDAYQQKISNAVT
jgi:hypothetical protein